MVVSLLNLLRRCVIIGTIQLACKDYAVQAKRSEGNLYYDYS